MTTQHNTFTANSINHYEPAHYRMTRCGTQRLLAALTREHPDRITKGVK